VVDALYDCKSEVIGPGFFRFKAEIGDFPAIFYSFLILIAIRVIISIFINIYSIHSVET
jgi:hypothetical protein